MVNTTEDLSELISVTLAFLREQTPGHIGKRLAEQNVTRGHLKQGVKSPRDQGIV